MNDPRFPDALRRVAPHRSHLFVPIVANERMVGGFGAVWWERPRDFAPNELALIDGIASQAGAAMRSAPLRREPPPGGGAVRPPRSLACRHGRAGSRRAARSHPRSHRARARRPQHRHLAPPRRVGRRRGGPARGRRRDRRHDAGRRRGASPRAHVGGPAPPAGRCAPTTTRPPAVPMACRPTPAPSPCATGWVCPCGGPATTSSACSSCGAALGRSPRATNVSSPASGTWPPLRSRSGQLFEERSRAYRDLTAAQDQLVRTEKLRALGEMAAGVAHDFNNLLASILGRAQLLLRRVSGRNSASGWR